MGGKKRDFYHIQDRLELAWRYTTQTSLANGVRIDDLSRQIEEVSIELQPMSAKLQKFIELTSQKISLLEDEVKRAIDTNSPPQQNVEVVKRVVEVSLSSSGMGFFSESLAEEEAELELFLKLDTVGVDLSMSATVMECRLSADSENPGYWIRARFTRNQDQKIDQLLAHVTHRQIAQLERRTDQKSDADGQLS